jgi:NAD(P)-dependent dehydrogenase (short-subunit alcohol dehydrogenase family)
MEDEMTSDGNVVVIGGTSGLGREVAAYYAREGRAVVISGRDEGRASSIAEEIGGETTAVGVDLSEPEKMAPALEGIGGVDHLVIAGIDRDDNRVSDYDVQGATRLTTLKLVGYPEVVHALASRLHDESAILLFGGLAKDKPYPGSTTVTTINYGVTGLVRTLVAELAPVRTNAIHPGIVADSPFWAAKPPEVLEAVRAKTPTGRPLRMQDIVHASVFLLENQAVNGVNLHVDGGWSLT